MPIWKIPGKLLLSLLLAVAPACGQPPAQEACPAPQQLGCPTDSLTFDTGIGDLLHTRCYPCHSPDGVERSVLLTDYAHVSVERMSIAAQVASCSMPPSGSPQLSSDERQQILDWFACLSPE